MVIDSKFIFLAFSNYYVIVCMHVTGHVVEFLDIRYSAGCMSVVIIVVVVVVVVVFVVVLSRN